MADKTKPRVNLELSGGSLQIQTDEVIYHIAVNPDAPAGRIAASSGAPATMAAPEPPAIEPPAAKEAAPAAEEKESGGDFYKQLSEELYAEVGSLARKLSVSLKDLKVRPEEVDLAGTGQQLESAKDELADIVAMTEQATMNIMDMTENIQADMAQAQKFIDTINSAEFISDADQNALIDQLKSLMAVNETTAPLLHRCLEFDQEVLSLLDEVVEALPASEKPTPAAPAEPEPTPAPEPETVTETRIVFPLNDLFQILYELCANDDVKKHIKAIWNKIDEFDAELVNAALGREADGFEKDEGFVMVPLEPLFTALSGATTNESFKSIIDKLNAARSQLFLDQSLPVEVSYEEVEVQVAPPETAPAEEAPAPEPVDPGPVGDTLADRVAQLRDKLTLHLAEAKEKSAGLTDFTPNTEIMDKFESSLCFYSDDRSAFTAAVKASQDLIARISASLTTITESLSFQDLSGQRIQKIVGTISTIQVELLKILVSFQSRIKAETEYKAETEEEKKELAQRDVDEMLDKLGLGPLDEEADLEAGPAAGSRLDQDSVDDLLAELGF